MIKSRIEYGAVLILSAALLFAYENKAVGFLVLYSLLFLLVLAAATALAAPFLIRVEEQAGQEELFKDEALEYRVQVENRGVFFYPRLRFSLHSRDLLEYGEGGGASAPGPYSTVSLGPFERLSWETGIRFPNRGVYRVGIRELEATDFLGLFRARIPIRRSLAVTAFPRSDEGLTLALRNEPQNTGLRQDPYNEDYTDVADTRKYNPSDSLKKIHWKLTAKRNELIVKTFHSNIPNKTLLYVDTLAPPMPGMAKASFEDKIIGYVTAAVDHFVRGRLPGELVWGAGERMVIDPAGEPDKLYRLLAEISFHTARSPLGDFCQEMEGTAGGFNLVAFLWSVDEGLFQTLKDFVSMDHNVFLYYFYSPARGLALGEETEYRLEGLRAFGVSVTRVDCDL